MKFDPLRRSFYEPSAKVVARALLGHWLVRRTPEGFCGGPIVETEAYVVGDAACHAANGKTVRNGVMFGPPGHAYVYFIYGCHYCVNAVCRPAGTAEALLIRAIEPAIGEDFMRRERLVEARRALTSGPAKLCEALKIDRALDGCDLCATGSLLFIAENPALAKFRKDRGPIVTTTRVGITRDHLLPLRFYLQGSECVSLRERKSVQPLI